MKGKGIKKTRIFLVWRLVFSHTRSDGAVIGGGAEARGAEKNSSARARVRSRYLICGSRIELMIGQVKTCRVK